MIYTICSSLAIDKCNLYDKTYKHGMCFTSLSPENSSKQITHVSLLPNLQSSLSPIQNPCYGYQARNICIQSYDVVHQTWNKLRVRCFVLTHCQGIHKERYEKGGLILIDSFEIIVILFMIENEIKISSEFNCISSSQISTLFIDTSPLPS